VKHSALKKTYVPGQQWQYNDVTDIIGWESCYEALEPTWCTTLEYRIKPEETKCRTE